MHKSQQTEHQDTYEAWRVLLLDENILSEDGLIDLERLEKKHPGELEQKQIIWIEAMQKGEVIEEDEEDEDDVAVVVVDPNVDHSEPEEPKKEIEVKKKIKVEPAEPEPKEEVEVVNDEDEQEDQKDAEEDDEELAPPPPPGAAKSVKAKDSWNVGDALTIQVEEDGEPEAVTVVKIAKDGIHLASSKDEDTEYLVDPAELKEMIVE